MIRRTFALAAMVLLESAPAMADEPRDLQPPASRATAPWRERFDAARRDLVEGRYPSAEVAFRVLAVEATTQGERSLASEMARLAAEYAVSPDASGFERPKRGDTRGDREASELALLYGTAALYGAGSGTWFLLETQPNTTVAAVLPFAALTAAPIIAVATVDGYSKLPRGLPHALSAGAFLGLQEGVWLVAYQHSQAMRVRERDPSSTAAWKPETVGAVLWGGVTAGAVLGGVLGSTLVTTPGRVSFTTSTTMWAGGLSALATAALAPDDPRRTERAFFAGGIGTQLGLATGLLFAGALSPSVTRVRIVDMIGLAGGLTASGLYLVVAGDVAPKVAEGLAAAGAVAGLATGWLFTAGMMKDTPMAAVQAPRLALEPSFRVVPGGATVGVSGSL